MNIINENKLETINNLFENSEIRSIWDSEKEDYYFSVVDVIEALANPKDPSDYWTTLKKRLIKEENSEIPTKCRKLKMVSKKDGKNYLTDLGEIATRELAKKHKPYGLDQNKEIAKLGGNVAKIARNDLENKLGESVISDQNFLKYQYESNKYIGDNNENKI